MKTSFKSFIKQQAINEAVSAQDFPKACSLVSSYLKKYLGTSVYSYPLPEKFKSSGMNGVGVRFFTGVKSFRLNWRISGVNQSHGLVSMDYWDGSKVPQPIPSHHIEFGSDESLARTLPFVRDFLLGKIEQSDGVFFDEQNEKSVELTEAVYSSEDVERTINNTLNALKQGISFNDQYRSGGKKKYGVRWDQVQAAIKQLYPNILKKDGRLIVVDPNDVKKIDKSKVLSAVMGDDDAVEFKVSKGRPETVIVDEVSDEDIERLSYEEQLDSLKTAMRLLMSGATNALFLGGRGGVGKTQTVENMLAERNLKDGDGYFKITGSASPVGIYRILWENRKEIILFDDSDSALIDQEGRNLFKAASDTKKVRKISWMKGGKNFVDPRDLPDPDDADYDDDEIGSSSAKDLLPRYFEFTGKIIFISNLPLNKLDPDGALRTRGYVINIDPTNEEIYDFVVKIVDKIPLEVNYKLDTKKRLEVVEVMRSRKIPEKSANIRAIVRALNTRAGVEKDGGTKEEWTKFVLRFA